MDWLARACLNTNPRGGTVTVDLSDVQPPNQVDCGDTSASAIIDTSGTASFATRTSSGARIPYTTSRAEDDDSVTVTVSNVDAGGAQATSTSPYDVVSTGRNGGTVMAKLSVS